MFDVSAACIINEHCIEGTDNQSLLCNAQPCLRGTMPEMSRWVYKAKQGIRELTERCY